MPPGSSFTALLRRLPPSPEHLCVSARNSDGEPPLVTHSMHARPSEREKRKLDISATIFAIDRALSAAG